MPSSGGRGSTRASSPTGVASTAKAAESGRRAGTTAAGAGPRFSEVAKLRAENERLRAKLAQAEAVIDVQGKVHALLEEISKSAASEE